MLYVEINVSSNVISKNKRVSFQIHIGVIFKKLEGSVTAHSYLFERTGCAAMRYLDIAAGIIYKRSIFFGKINKSNLHFRQFKW